MFGFAVVKLQALVGVPLPTVPDGWNAEVVQTVLTVLSGLGVRQLTKKKTTT